MLNRNSSYDDKRKNSEAVFQFLSDALFDEISFISFPFVQARQAYTMVTEGSSASTSGSDYPWGDAPDAPEARTDYVHDVLGPVKAKTRYWAIGRITNTSEGKFLSPSRTSRMRCSFYVENGDDLDGYLLSSVVYDSFDSLNTIDSMDVFRAYAGVRFVDGVASFVVKEAGGSEVLREIDGVRVSGGGASTTYRLDMYITGKTVSMRIDSGETVVLPADFTSGFEGEVQSFLPLILPTKSTTGQAVNIVVENFQYIQDN